MKQRISQAGFFLGAVAAALVAMVVLLLLVQATNASVNAGPLEVIDALWKGAFRNSRKVADVVVFWIPLALVSMGLVLTFRAGLWNIGVEGQMVLGGLFAAGTVFALEDINSPFVLIPASIIAAMIGGALWATLSGLLRVRFGVHEIFSGVALNFVANQMTLQMIAGPWRPAESDKAQYSRPFTDAAVWPGMTRDFNVSLLALVITGIVTLAVIFLLGRTRWGLQLKATGKNPRSALLLGVPTGLTAISAMAVCGALAGVGGAHRLLFTYQNVRGQFSGGIGFLGLLVVLLAGNRGLWVPFIAFAFAAIKAGSTQLQFLRLDTSLTGVLQSLLVLFVLFSNGLRDRMSRRASANLKESVQEELPSSTTILQEAQSDG